MSIHKASKYYSAVPLINGNNVRAVASQGQHLEDQGRTSTHLQSRLVYDGRNFAYPGTQGWSVEDPSGRDDAHHLLNKSTEVGPNPDPRNGSSRIPQTPMPDPWKASSEMLPLLVDRTPPNVPRHGPWPALNDPAGTYLGGPRVPGGQLPGVLNRLYSNISPADTSGSSSFLANGLQQTTASVGTHERDGQGALTEEIQAFHNYGNMLLSSFPDAARLVNDMRQIFRRTVDRFENQRASGATPPTRTKRKRRRLTAEEKSHQKEVRDGGGCVQCRPKHKHCDHSKEQRKELARQQKAAIEDRQGSPKSSPVNSSLDSPDGLNAASISTGSGTNVIDDIHSVNQNPRRIRRSEMSYSNLNRRPGPRHDPVMEPGNHSLPSVRCDPRKTQASDIDDEATGPDFSPPISSQSGLSPLAEQPTADVWKNSSRDAAKISDRNQYEDGSSHIEPNAEPMTFLNDCEEPQMQLMFTSSDRGRSNGLGIMSPRPSPDEDYMPGADHGESFETLGMDQFADRDPGSESNFIPDSSQNWPLFDSSSQDTIGLGSTRTPQSQDLAIFDTLLTPTQQTIPPADEYDASAKVMSSPSGPWHPRRL